MIDRDTIDRVREQTSITAVVGESVKLRRRGRNHVGLCPFHQEKTPSFHVDEERGFFHCFGCGASGDVFTFLEQQEGLTFGEALRKLAERAGIVVEETEAPEVRRRDEAARQQRQALCDVGAAAAEYFERMLREHPLRGGAQRELARQSLVSSSPPDPVSDALHAFRVGYAPYGWRGLVVHLRQSGLDEATAERLGLLAPGRRGAFVDRFRHRLMMAVLDLHGRVVAFVGRVLPEPEDAAMQQAGVEPTQLLDTDVAVAQLGCPESEVYHPHQLVFGLHQARQAIRAVDHAVLVDSCLDVLSLHAHGMKNVVSVLTPTLTLEQALLVKRFTSRVTLLQSEGEGARRVVRHAQDALRQAGLLVKVATLPEPVAPSELIRLRGAQAVRQALSAARGLTEYLVDSVLDPRLRRDEPARAQAKVKWLWQLVSRETDPLLRALTAQYVDTAVSRLGIAGVQSLRQLRTWSARRSDAELRVQVDRDMPLEEPAEDRAPRIGAVSTPAQVSEPAPVAEAPQAPLAGPDPETVTATVLEGLLQFPQLLADPEITPLLESLEGDAAAAVAAVWQAWDGAESLNFDVILERVAPRLKSFVEGRRGRGRNVSVAKARVEVFGALASLDGLRVSNRFGDSEPE